MKEKEDKRSSWRICEECKGIGKKRQRIRKKAKLAYQKLLSDFEKNKENRKEPIPPKANLSTCINCSGSGLITAIEYPKVAKENYPDVAIIGGGIGGVALAVACLHRGIPFTLYERDENFEARSQGYGLTLQQASRAIKGLGILSLEKGVVSTRHVVHNPEGKVLGEWGMRKWVNSEDKLLSKKTNIHIARQSLRLALLEQLKGNEFVKWGHKFVGFKQGVDEKVNIEFLVNDEVKHATSDLLVGADGIRSTVRKLLIDEKILPLQYLGCIVILGICPLENIKNIDSPLLDGATVFQTANGNERIYMMPYASDSVMWQLSFPISEVEAKELSCKGVKALKEEACRRTQWHCPIPQILEATEENLISGYPVYDRELLNSELLEKESNVTLMGDAAHPMSPFKGQGANQALLDALSLAREISKGCRSLSGWREIGIRESVLNKFEEEMLTRSASKVKGSAEAATFLHSEEVLKESNTTRGKSLMTGR